MFPNPIALELGPLKIHWYGIMYAISFILSYIFLIHGEKHLHSHLTKDQKENILIGSILGVLIGGRLGYILFYNLPFYLQNPHKLLSVWEGGMSFHGGLIGVLIAIIYHSKRKKIPFLKISDLLTAIAPLGLFLGRLGNFINSELYGRISPNNQFCLNFPTDPTNCRYPSQLLESLFEGLILFIILNAIKSKLKPKPGIITGLFLILYGSFRFAIEFLREPDLQIGYLANHFTMGQILCLPLIIAGIIIIFLSNKTNVKTKKTEHNFKPPKKE